VIPADPEESTADDEEQPGEIDYDRWYPGAASDEHPPTR